MCPPSGSSSRETFGILGYQTQLAGGLMYRSILSPRTTSPGLNISVWIRTTFLFNLPSEGHYSALPIAVALNSIAPGTSGATDAQVPVPAARAQKRSAF